jgi:glycerophosphoryl diester phosphodiesterase
MKVIAHRGASIEHPENTIDAIKHAFSLGVYAVEIDVHLSKDDIPVVIHDETLERTHNDKRAVFDHSHSELPVPTLEQVLALPRDCYLMIEIKEGRHDAKRLIEKVVDLAKNHQKIILASFSHGLLAGIQGFELLGLSDQEVPPLEWVCLDEKIIDETLMKLLEGKRVWTYTVDCPVRAEELYSLGVEGFVTNDPRKLLPSTRK